MGGVSTDHTSSSTSQEVIDLQQRLAILKQKRLEDKTKIKELEKFRLQFQQVSAVYFFKKTFTCNYVNKIHVMLMQIQLSVYAKI